jgi:hypothetical protein
VLRLLVHLMLPVLLHLQVPALQQHLPPHAAALHTSFPAKPANTRTQQQAL